MNHQPLLAGIELGGTKSVVLLARGRTIFDSMTVPTTDPESTLLALERWLANSLPAMARDVLTTAALGANVGPLPPTSRHKPPPPKKPLSRQGEGGARGAAVGG